MQTVDTLKLKLTEDSIKDLNLNMFERNEKYHPVDLNTGEKELKETRYILPDKRRPFGVNGIYIKDNRFGKEVILEFSSKVLKKDYPGLLNPNTIEQAENNINSEALSFKKDSFSNGDVLRVDITNDLKL